MNASPHLLIIDDNAYFRDTAKKHLQECFKVCCLDSRQDLNELAAKVQAFEPAFLLLDVNLHTTSASKTILEYLTDQHVLPEDCNIWMIGQGTFEEIQTTAQTFQKINANVQDEVIRKPLNHARKLYAMLNSDIFYDPVPPFDDHFPLPVRVIDSNGKETWSNKLWTRNIDIDYDPDWLTSNTIQREPEEHIGDPFFGEGVGYKIRQLRIEQNEHTFLVQMALVNYPDHNKDSHGESVALLLKQIKRMGFNHARYYRIRELVNDTHKERKEESDNDAGIRLEHCSGRKLKKPIFRPLTGELRRRMQGYLTTENKQKLNNNELVYCIRSKEDDEKAKDDPEIRFWNEKLGIRCTNWLELPVLENDERDSSGSGLRLKGLFIFDRQESGDATDDTISEAQVLSLQAYFRSLLHIHIASLNRQRLRDLESFEARINKMDKALFEAETRDQCFRIISEAACEVGKADTVAMAIPTTQSVWVKVVDVYRKGSGEPPAVKGLAFSSEASAHPVVEVLQKKHIVCYQDFRQSTSCQVLLDHLEGRRQETDYRHLVELKDQQKTDYAEWLKNDVGAVLAIPISLKKGEKPIGCIVLHYASAFCISRRRKKRINAVLQRARWAIQDYTAREERNNWLNTLAHELKSNLNLARNHANELAGQYGGLQDDENWRVVTESLDAADELSHNWLDTIRRPARQPVENVYPKRAIETYKKTHAHNISFKRVEITSLAQDDACWNMPLAANTEVFQRVLNILLDNAIKFGRAFIRKWNDPVPVDIRLSKPQEGKLALSVCNPGHMSDEAYRLRFEAGHLPAQRQADGAHVGLSVAKQLAELYGAQLELENCQDGEHVKAWLCWPTGGAQE